MMIIALLSLLAACDKDDPVIPNEEEVITTLRYTLTPDAGGNSVVLSFQDLDGDGGDAPVITAGTLAKNTVYNASLTLSNEQESPADDITAEILEEDEDHQFFFQTTVNNLQIRYEDTDDNGDPIGLKTQVTTGEAASGDLTITLRHEPNKSVDGNIENAGGETDIEVKFNINVE